MLNLILQKFQYLPNILKYFGHEIIQGHLQPDKDKVLAIINYDTPNNKKSLSDSLEW